MSRVDLTQLPIQAPGCHNSDCLGTALQRDAQHQEPQFVFQASDDLTLGLACARCGKEWHQFRDFVQPRFPLRRHRINAAFLLFAFVGVFFLRWTLWAKLGAAAACLFLLLQHGQRLWHVIQRERILEAIGRFGVPAPLPRHTLELSQRWQQEAAEPNDALAQACLDYCRARQRAEAGPLRQLQHDVRCATSAGMAQLAQILAHPAIRPEQQAYLTQRQAMLQQIAPDQSRWHKRLARMEELVDVMIELQRERRLGDPQEIAEAQLALQQCADEGHDLLRQCHAIHEAMYSTETEPRDPLLSTN